MANFLDSKYQIYLNHYFITDSFVSHQHLGASLRTDAASSSCTNSD